MPYHASSVVLFPSSVVTVVLFSTTVIADRWSVTVVPFSTTVIADRWSVTVVLFSTTVIADRVGDCYRRLSTQTTIPPLHIFFILS